MEKCHRAQCGRTAPATMMPTVCSRWFHASSCTEQQAGCTSALPLTSVCVSVDLSFFVILENRHPVPGSDSRTATTPHKSSSLQLRPSELGHEVLGGSLFPREMCPLNSSRLESAGHRSGHRWAQSLVRSCWRPWWGQPTKGSVLPITPWPRPRPQQAEGSRHPCSFQGPPALCTTSPHVNLRS